MRKLALLAAFAAISMVASAQLYVQNPHAPGAAGANGLSAFKGNLGVPADNYDRQVGDDFTVTGPGWSINRVVSSWVQFTAGDTNAVTQMNLAFYNISGGVVGSLVASRTGTAVRSIGPGTYFGRPEEVIDSTFAAVNLAPGNYFMMVQTQVNHNWFWLTSSPTTPIAGSAAQIQRGPGTTGAADPTWPVTWTPTGPSNPIFTTAYDQNFKLYGTAVPEPASLAALGLGALALLRRRKAKKA
jgi:hypothetical protein